jgi:hypothetical protein
MVLSFLAKKLVSRYALLTCRSLSLAVDSGIKPE